MSLPPKRKRKKRCPYHLNLRLWNSDVIRYPRAHPVHQKQPEDQWFDTEQEATFWCDVDQHDEEDTWHDAQECARDEPELKQVRNLSDVKVLKAFVASTKLLDQLGHNRSPAEPYSTSGFVVQNEQSLTVPMVIDTGCSISVTPFKEDFVTDIEPTQEDSMKGLKDSVKVVGIGWVEWTIRDLSLIHI